MVSAADAVLRVRGCRGGRAVRVRRSCTGHGWAVVLRRERVQQCPVRWSGFRGVGGAVRVTGVLSCRRITGAGAGRRGPGVFRYGGGPLGAGAVRRGGGPGGWWTEGAQAPRARGPVARWPPPGPACPTATGPAGHRARGGPDGGTARRAHHRLSCERAGVRRGLCTVRTMRTVRPMNRASDGHRTTDQPVREAAARPGSRGPSGPAPLLPLRPDGDRLRLMVTAPRADRPGRPGCGRRGWCAGRFGPGAIGPPRAVDHRGWSGPSGSTPSAGGRSVGRVRGDRGPDSGPDTGPARCRGRECGAAGREVRSRTCPGACQCLRPGSTPVHGYRPHPPPDRACTPYTPYDLPFPRTPPSRPPGLRGRKPWPDFTPPQCGRHAFAGSGGRGGRGSRSTCTGAVGGPSPSGCTPACPRCAARVVAGPHSFCRMSAIRRSRS